MSLVGNIEHLPLTDVLQVVGMTGKSGVLLMNDETRGAARLVFRSGRLVSAWGPPALRVLTDLFSDYRIPLPGTFVSLKQNTRAPLSALHDLFASARIDPAAMQQHLVEMVTRVVAELLTWPTGMFQFVARGNPGDERDLPPEWIWIQDGLDPTMLGLDSARAADERKRASAPTEAKHPPTVRDREFVDLADELADEFDLIRRSRPDVVTPGLEQLKSMLFELQFAHAQHVISLLLLRYSSVILTRAIFFILRKDRLEGVGEFGILPTDRSGTLVQTIRVPADAPSVLRDSAEKQIPLKLSLNTDRPWDRYLVEQFGGRYPQEVFVGPVLSHTGELRGVLYGDNLPKNDPIGDTSCLEIFLSQAGISMERVSGS